ncbi:MAG: hypothetical protein AAFX78_06955 [Cyanobacteria bacterium J06638_20]
MQGQLFVGMATVMDGWTPYSANGIWNNKRYELASVKPHLISGGDRNRRRIVMANMD